MIKMEAETKTEMSNVGTNENESVGTDNINTSGLVEGMVVKNYKEMCTILGCKPNTGGSKKYQLKNWKRYFDYDKSGQKFIITEVYETPFPSEDARKKKEGLYVKYIELLLLKYLFSCNGYQTKITKGKLYQILGLTNKNYYQLKCSGNSSGSNLGIVNVKSQIKENYGLNIETFNVNHFLQRAEAKLTKILYTALDSMSKRFLIKYHTEYVLKIPCEKGEENGYYDFADISEVLNTEPNCKLELASPRQVSYILAAQHLVLESMGYANITQVALRYKLKEFNNKVNDYLYEHYGWLGFFSQLSIIYINDIGKEIPLKAEEIRKLTPNTQRKQLNRIIVTSLNQQAQEKYDKNCDKKIELMYQELNEKQENNQQSNEANSLIKSKFYALQPYYTEAQRELADYLINIKDIDYDEYYEMWEKINKQDISKNQ